jgi:hypothetical protein
LPSIGIGNDEFARAGDAAWGAELGVFRKPVLDAIEDVVEVIGTVYSTMPHKI